MLSSRGAPARLLREWQNGGFELVVSPMLVAEIERALGYPKLRKQIEPGGAAEFVAWLADVATSVDDPDLRPGIRSKDPGDDYLLALAQAARAVLVSGDKHLLDLRSEGLPIYAAAEFLDLIRDRDDSSG